MAVTVGWPPLRCVIRAETRSPTFIPLMLVTLPLNRVALVIAAVTVRPGPPIVTEVLLTAVTGPATNISTTAPPPGWEPPPLLPPGATAGG